MVNGYPGSICYAEQTVRPENINVSANASLSTEILLNQPVYCNAGVQYCICILSDSNKYQMWVGELGAKDVASGKYVTAQPYTTGVLFSSSNAQTWTAHQTKDLKFKIYKCVYQGNGTVIFNDVSATNFNRLLLAIDYVDYKNNGIVWYYKLPGSTVWKAIETYVDRDLDKIS